MSRRAPDGEQQVELHGPKTDGWHTTTTRDWIALCDGLGPTAFRLYCVCRSLIIDKWGDVRKLSLNDMCELLPGVNGKPNSLTRIRDAIQELTTVGLFTTPEGERITTSSRTKAAAAPMRIQIHDMPPAGYGGWRNAFDKLDAIQAQRAVPQVAPTPRESPKALPQAGRKNDPLPRPGRKNDPLGRKSGPHGRNSDPDSAVTSKNAAHNEVLEVSPPSKVDRAGGRRPGTASKRAPSSGCAAPAEQREVERERVSWGDLRQVVSAIPAPLAALLERDFPAGLPTTVNDAVARLLAEPRTAEEAAERITRRWLRYEDDALSLSGRGIDTPIAVLHELLAPSYCEGNNARCEDGFDLDRQSDCPQCVELKEDFRAARAASASTSAPAADPDFPGQRQTETYTPPPIERVPIGPVQWELGSEGVRARELARQAASTARDATRNRSTRAADRT